MSDEDYNKIMTLAQSSKRPRTQVELWKATESADSRPNIDSQKVREPPTIVQMQTLKAIVFSPNIVACGFYIIPFSSSQS